MPLRAKTIRSTYRGHKITITKQRWSLGKWHVRVDFGYMTAARSFMDAQRYAYNAIAYHLDGVASWPIGVPTSDRVA